MSPSTMSRLSLAALVAALASAAPADMAARQIVPVQGGYPKSVMYMSNNKDPNGVAIFDSTDNGGLLFGNWSGIGGSGGPISIDSSVANLPPQVDAFFSSNEILVSGDVNTAAPADVALKPLGGPNSGKPGTYPLPGEFPVSVALSSSGIVCVAFGGAKDGVSCTTSNATSLGSFDPLRPFGLKQTTPPVGISKTVSSIWFNNDETALLATTKGDSTNTDVVSRLFSFPIANGAVSTTPAIYTFDSASKLVSGGINIPGGNHILVADSTGGVTELAPGGTNGFTLVQNIPLKTYRLGCLRLAWSTATNTAFAISDLDTAVFEIDPAGTTTDPVAAGDSNNPGSTTAKVNTYPAPNRFSAVLSYGSQVYALYAGQGAPGSNNTATGGADGQAAIYILDTSAGKGKGKWRTDAPATSGKLKLPGTIPAGLALVPSEQTVSAASIGH